MLFFSAALIAAVFASGAWCAGELLPGRGRAWWMAGRPVSASAVALVAVVALAAGLRFLLVPPHHAMYVDEPWYAEAACNMGRLGRLVVCEERWPGTSCVPYAKAWGWPVLLAPWTLLYGCATSVGIDVNRLIGTATVLLAAVVARCAGATWWQSVIVAALLAIHPVHATWSATGETNVAAAAMLLAGLCGALVYVRTGRACAGALMVSGLGLSAAIRPESLVPALVSAVIVALLCRTAPSVLLACATAIVCAVAAASAQRLWAMNEAISRGAFLSLANIPHGVLLVSRAQSPAVHGLVLLAALAAVGAALRPEQRAAAWLLLCTGLGAAIAALSYDRFHERMLLGATVALLPLSGLLLSAGSAPAAGGRARPRRQRVALGAGLIGLVALLWGPELRSASLPPETQVLETRIAERLTRLQFPADSLFIAERPPVVAAAGMAHVMATERAVANPEELSRTIATGRPVYFLCDMYCEPGFAGGTSTAWCRQMLDRFALAPVAEEALHSRTYTLYRVTGPAAAGSAPPRCPASPG